MKLWDRKILIRTILLFVLLYLKTFLYAQSTLFNKAYYYNNNYTNTQTDLSTAMIADTSGYMIASRVWNYSTGNSFIHIIKTDLFGDTLFSKAYGDPGYQLTMSSMEKTEGNNFLLCGVKSNVNTKEVKGMVVKINAQGDTLWTKTYSSGLLKTIFIQFVETSNGEIVFAGWTNNLNAPAKAFVVKTDSLGNKIWEYNYGKVNNDVYVNSIAKTKDNGYIIAGSGTNDANILLQKIDVNGKLVWNKLFWPIDEYILDLILLRDGNYLLGGEKSVGGFGVNSGAGFLYKIDSTGQVIWNKTINLSNKTEGFYKLLELSDGSIITAGATHATPSGKETGWLVKHNNSGDTLWSRKYGYENDFDKDGFFYDVKQTINQGLVMCGFTTGPTGTQDVWVVSVDSLGCDTVGCLTSNIEDVPFIPKVDIFPNPCDQFLQILFPQDLSQRETSATIYDLTFRIMKTINFNFHSSNFISTSDLPVGIYIIQIKSTEKVIDFKKILVIH